MDERTQFDYLLNAFERASQAERPAVHSYAEKRRALFAYVRDLERRAAPAGWLPIETAPLTGKKVILFYLNRNNKPRTVMARWLTDEQAAESDADGVGLLGGWYECIDNWEDCAQLAIYEGEPTYWQPLPAYPVATSDGLKRPQTQHQR